MIRRSKRTTLGAAAVALSALNAACGNDRPAAVAGEAVTVRARLASAQRLEVPQEVVLYGVVEAERTAAVSTRVMAMVTAVEARVGERVRRGQLLVEIDPQASRGQLSQARGALAQARAALALAERNFARFRALAEADAASELELDMARAGYEQASGAVEQAEGAVAAAASVAADSRVVAPFSGRVYRQLVEVGDLAAPGRPLLMLESEGVRRLRVAVPESLAVETALGVGDELPVTIDSRPDLGRMAGRVVERTPGADPASHSFEFRLELPVEDLPTGAVGRAWLPSGRRERVVVPADAVLRRGGLTLVALRAEDGSAATRAVTVGAGTPDGGVEVLSGLAGGETVLTGLAAPPPAGARVEEDATAGERRDR